MNVLQPVQRLREAIHGPPRPRHRSVSTRVQGWPLSPTGPLFPAACGAGSGERGPVGLGEACGLPVSVGVGAEPVPWWTGESCPVGHLTHPHWVMSTQGTQGAHLHCPALSIRPAGKLGGSLNRHSLMHHRKAGPQRRQLLLGAGLTVHVTRAHEAPGQRHWPRGSVSHSALMLQ